MTSAATSRGSSTRSAQAEESGADLAVFPELAITGYPPEDLLLKPGFVADNQVALAKVAQATERCVAVVGFVDERVDLYDSAAVCAGGEVRGIYHKCNLPNYSVFDEQRYFVPGTGAESLYLIGGARVGVSVCEDAWDPTGPISFSGRGRGGADGQHQRLALLRPASRGAPAHVGHEGGRRFLRPCLREPGGRPGRTGLRRRLDGLRCRGPADGGDAAVRRGRVDLRHRSAAHVPQEAPRPERKAPAPRRCPKWS